MHLHEFEVQHHHQCLTTGGDTFSTEMAAAAPARAAGPTRLAYFDDMWAVRSTATVLSLQQVLSPSLSSWPRQSTFRKFQNPRH